MSLYDVSYAAAAVGLRGEAKAEMQSIEAEGEHKRQPVVAVGKVGRPVSHQEKKIHLRACLQPRVHLVHLTVTEGRLPPPEVQQPRFVAADVNDKVSTLYRILHNPKMQAVLIARHRHGDRTLGLSRAEEERDEKRQVCDLLHMMDFFFLFFSIVRNEAPIRYSVVLPRYFLPALVGEEKAAELKVRLVVISIWLLSSCAGAFVRKTWKKTQVE